MIDDDEMNTNTPSPEWWAEALKDPVFKEFWESSNRERKPMSWEGPVMKTLEEQTAFSNEMLALTDKLQALVRSGNGILRIEDIPEQTEILAAIKKLTEDYKK